MGPKKNPNDPKWVPPSPKGDSHPKSAADKSHDLSRPKCCLVCMRWTKTPLTDAIKNGIHSLFGIQFDYSDRRIPLGICSTCQRGIYDYNKTKINSKKLELVYKNFDFIKIAPALRSEQVCSCQICLVAKGPVKAVAGAFKKIAGPSKKVLAPIPENPTPQKSTGTTSKTTPTPKSTGTKPKNRDDLPKCPHCLDPLGPGLHKSCNNETLEKNIAKKCEENPTVGNRVAVRSLRSKEPSPGGRVHLALGGRSDVAIAINAPADRKKNRSQC